ncbi:hypothetical protein EJ04DRAFT_564843 [Polyplosphaeria fusca]|uniref:Chromo domain-containing protein n=1 Tax=Polyplosphaeria fusca TaxID=682080 RepID=A0A9P4QTW8_9PLEO|nr:hypothetical protein EJ04DRAFT_564843 [Polyplosphaeria fusca]
MPVRGRGRGRPRGSSPGRTIIYAWEEYTPSREVYNSLFRLHKAPPTITASLPSSCPIPNARSCILERRQTEDGLSRQYFRVLIRRQRVQSESGSESQHDSDSDSDDEDEEDEVEEVDMSRILQYVSMGELERFENAEFEAEAAAEAAVRRADAEELARKRLEKNARTAKGSRMLSGRGLEDDAPRRGRPSKRGRGRWRGGHTSLSRGAGPLPSVVQQMALDDEPHPVTVAEIPESSSEDELQGPSSAANHLSPGLQRSSFIAGSALADTSIFDIEESEKEDDDDKTSMPSAALQLFDERRHREPSLGELGNGTKRKRTEGLTMSRRPSTTHRDIPPPKPDPRLSKQATSQPPLSSSSSTLASSRPSHPTPEVPETQENTIVAEEEDAEDYAVSAILAHSFDDQGTKYYLVQWEGYPASDWLLEDDMEGAREMVDAYERSVRRKKGKGTK